MSASTNGSGASDGVAQRRDEPGGVLASLRGGVVVSSQAMNPDSPLRDPRILSLMAQAAELGGAAGFRVDGAEVVRDLRAHTALPIIAIRKRRTPDADAFITTHVQDALDLVAAGADIVAAQATGGSRPAESFAEIAAAVHGAGRLVMADVASAPEAAAAAEAGADLVATTLTGYTADTRGAVRPPFELVRRLCDSLDVPVVLEGGIWTAEHVTTAFRSGAWAVVVGSAVTAPDLITERLVAAARAGRT